jgi:hypothetical protein
MSLSMITKCFENHRILYELIALVSLCFFLLPLLYLTIITNKGATPQIGLELSEFLISKLLYVLV